MSRPRIAIPGRFSESASALRYQAVVVAKRLAEAVWAVGGDPVVLLPAPGPDGTDWKNRLAGFQGVLLPGGGDINPSRYGMNSDDPSLYDVNELQDETDFSLATYALEQGIPLLAICRGLHVINAVRGGTLVIDMPVNHRHHTHEMEIADPENHLGLSGVKVTASCYHHQAIDRLGEGLQVLAKSADGYIEAVKIEAKAWSAAVQWHPEDTWTEDPQQRAVLGRLVKEASAN